MNPSDWKNIKNILSATLDLPDAERALFLANETDEVIRQEVEKLLDAYNKSENFIEKPFFTRFGLRANSFEDNLTGKRIDDYLILKKIGEGGMGTVFLAEHVGDNFSQKVALKLIKRGMDTNSVLNRFLMERQILAQLEHPNIARLLDGGSTEDGLPFFVMEFIEGENIKTFCEHHQYNITERLELFAKVCQAISYAHQKLIVHRDIKPSNIVVTDSGEPKLLDFGIAKLLSPDWNDSTSEATGTNLLLMTPEYASPEQLRGQITTTATDVYSLGIVLYELLTGTRPFQFKSKNPVEISEQLLTQEPLRPSECGRRITQRGLPDQLTAENQDLHLSKDNQIFNSQTTIRNLRGDLDNIILKAIRKAPENRYQSVTEFCEDVHRYLIGLPVKATTDTQFYRLQKFIGRHQKGVLTASLMVVLLVSATVITAQQYFIAQSARAKAEERFLQMRGLAKSLLNETNEALMKLPEGLEVRKGIIEKSVAVLDSLATDDTQDTEFLSELANAYHQLGRLRNWNLRDSDKALSALQKGLNLREKVIKIDPNNIEFRNKYSATLGALQEFYAIQGNSEKVIEFYQKIIENNRQRIAIEPNNAQLYYEIAANFDALSEFQVTAEQQAEKNEVITKSFEMIERAIELQQVKEKTPETQTQLCFYLMLKADLLKKSNKPDEALSVYQSAVEIADQAFAVDNSQIFAFNHSIRIRRLMADIHRARGEWLKALTLYELCIYRLRQNKENKHLNQTQMPMSIAVYTMRHGVALERIGRTAEGAQTFETGLSQFNQFLENKKSDISSLLYAPEFFKRFPSEYFIGLKKNRQAANIWQSYIERLDPFLQKSPNDGGILKYSAIGYENKADALGGYHPEKQSFSETDRAILEEALENYEKSLVLVKKIMSSGESPGEIKNKIQILDHKISLLKTKLT